MNKQKVLITDCDHENIEIEKHIFSKNSVTFELKQCKTEEDIIKWGKGSEVFITQYAPITKKVLDSLPKLKFVIRYGVGVNNVDVEAGTERGVQICNVPDYGINEVADHAIALMLNFTRKIGMMNNYVRLGNWNYQESIPILRQSEQTVGIIGLGRIGSSFAKKIHALGFKVIGFDPKYQHNKSNHSDFINMVTFNELLEKSDIISIHCPLENAYHLIGEVELRKMKSSVYLINVSRGGIINELALDKALKEKRIAGAAVDVVENEPMPENSNLFKHDNFICTPHMAWYSVQAAQELKRKVAEEAIRCLRKIPVQYPINQVQKIKRSV